VVRPPSIQLVQLNHRVFNWRADVGYLVLFGVATALLSGAITVARMVWQRKLRLW